MPVLTDSIVAALINKSSILMHLEKSKQSEIAAQYQ